MDLDDEVRRLKVELAGVTALKNSLQDLLEGIEKASGWTPFDEGHVQYIKRLREKCAELESWRASMLQVDSEWDPQEVGRVLNLPLGSSIRSEILPAILKLQAKCAEMRAVISDISKRDRWSCDVLSGRLEREKDGPWVLVNHQALEHALSGDCGKGWKSPFAQTVARLEKLKASQ